MNPKHPELLKGALLKFEFLTYPQITDLFRGDICGRSVERCIGIVAKSKFASRHTCSLKKKRVYTAFPNAFLALEGSFSGNPDDFEREFNHRAACTDALLALARRAFVIEITAEHELKRLNYDSVVIGRRPDGLFTLARGDDEPITVALEVETSLRNRDRIKSVIQCYENTFIEDPDQLSGVLIVAHTPPIVHAYQEVIEQVSKKYQDRFIISNKSDISDVKETILGRTLVSISDHPKSPIKKWAGVRPSKPFKTEPAPSPPITGYTYRDSDSEFGTRSKI